MIKIKQIKLVNGKIIKTIYYKTHTKEQEEAEKYIKSIKAIEICKTYLENGKGYIDYYMEKKND